MEKEIIKTKKGKKEYWTNIHEEASKFIQLLHWMVNVFSIISWEIEQNITHYYFQHKSTFKSSIFNYQNLKNVGF